MTTRDGRKPVGWELSREVIEAVKDEADEQNKAYWQVLENAARTFLALGEDTSVSGLERVIERYEGKLQDVRDERKSLESQEEILEERLAELRDRRDTLEEERATYRESLDDILGRMQNSGKPAVAWISELRDLASREYGSDTKPNVEEVLGDLRERNRETTELAGQRFRMNAHAGAEVVDAAVADGGSNDPFADVVNNEEKAENDD